MLHVPDYTVVALLLLQQHLAHLPQHLLQPLVPLLQLHLTQPPLLQTTLVLSCGLRCLHQRCLLLGQPNSVLFVIGNALLSLCLCALIGWHTTFVLSLHFLESGLCFCA